jgi:hypothetical protein
MSLLNETTVSFSAAARTLPKRRSDRPTSPVTLWRWHTAGVRGHDGRRVYLEAVKIGSVWVTSLESLHRFIEATTPKPASLTRDSKPSVRTPTQRAKSDAHAKKMLDAAHV